MSDDEPEINITPLIDVVFVVLIAFILLAPLLELDEVLLPLGKELPLSAMQSSGLTIHVKADDTIWISGSQVARENLPKVLAHLHEQLPAERPQLYHDSRASFGTYQWIKNSLEASGYEELDVMLQPS